MNWIIPAILSCLGIGGTVLLICWWIGEVPKMSGDSLVDNLASVSWTQHILTISGWGVYLYLEVTGQSPSQLLAGFVGLMTGFYFNSVLTAKKNPGE